MAISTNGTVLTRLAGALYNTQMSNATYEEVKALDPATLANTLYARDFSSVSDTTVAGTLVSNLGLSTVAGLSNWVAAQLTAAGSAKGAKIVELLNGFAQMSADATYGAASTAFNTKVDSALALSQKAGNAGGTFSSISTTVSGATFTLTTGTDNFTGASASDTFDGSLNASGNQTYSVTDLIDGGLGNDTANLTFTTAGAGTYVPEVLKNVETVNLTAAGTTTFNFVNATGVTKATNLASAGDLTLRNLDVTATARVANTAANTTVQLKSNTMAGATDALALQVSGVTGNVTINDVDNSLTDAFRLETLNIATDNTASTIGTLTVTNLGMTKVVVTGDQNLTVTTLTDGTSTGVTLKTIDASALTGNLSVTGAHNTASQAGNSITGGSGNDALTGGAGNDVIIGGAGNDTITANAGDDSITAGDGDDTVNIAGNFDGLDTLDGGAGTDILRASAAITSSSTAAARVTNFETIQADVAATAAGATDLAQNILFYTGLTKGRISAVTYADDDDATSDNATSAVSFSNTPAGFAGIDIRGSSISATGSAGDVGTFGVTVSTTRAVNTTADALTVALGSGTSSAVGATTAGAITLNVTANDEETLTIVSQGAANTIGTLTVANAKSLVVNASTALTVGTLTNGGAVLKTLDASASTADVIFTTQSMSSAATVTGGSGNDSLTGSTGADSILGGAGNDSLQGNGGTDTIDGGTGNDILTGGSGVDSILGGDGNDTIDSGAGNDLINGGAGNDEVRFDLSAATGTVTISNLDRFDVIDGGVDTDAIRLSGTALSGTTTLDLSSQTLTTFTGVSNVERLSINTDSDTNATVRSLVLNLGDTLLTSFGGNLTIVKASGYDDTALTINASGVTAGTNTVTVNLGHVSNTAGEVLNYTLGANIDNVAAATDLADVFTVTTQGYLASNDTLKGGTGSDQLTIDTNAAVTITADQLIGLSSIESIVFDNATTATAAAVITVSEAVALANASTSNNTFTVTREATETGTLRVTGSSVSTMNLALNGAIGADTLTGGAANDVFAGGLGSDSLTGGAGNDIFAYTVAGDVGAGEVISGGEGTDTIRQNDNGTTATTNDFSAATVTSIEALDLLSDTANNTVIFSVSQLPANTLITESTASATESIAQLNMQPGTNDVSGYTFGTTRDKGVSLTNAGSNAAFSVTATGTSKPDTITGGSNDDTITGGNGADSLIGGAGNDVIILGETAASIDEIQLTSTTGSDTITGFTAGTGGDQIDITTTVASAPITGAGNAAISAATATSLAEVTAATTLTTQNIIVLSGATYATSALAEAAIEATGGRALTFANAPAANDDIFVVWSDGSNSYLGVYNLGSNATTPAAAGVMTTLATIVGVNASVAGTLVAGNFDFV